MTAGVSLRWIVMRRMPRSPGGQQDKNPAEASSPLLRTGRMMQRGPHKKSMEMQAEMQKQAQSAGSAESGLAKKGEKVDAPVTQSKVEREPDEHSWNPFNEKWMRHSKRVMNDILKIYCNDNAGEQDFPPIGTRKSPFKRVFLFLTGFFASLFIWGQGPNLAWAQLQSFDDHFRTSELGAVQKRETDNFTVSWVHPRDGIFADGLLKHLELADRDLAPIFRDVSGARKKVPVEIFPDLKSFSAVSELPVARFKATGTIALTLDQRLMILSPRNVTGGYTWSVTVVHEYTHYLIREITADFIPIWLHEGVAQLYQGYPYQKKANLSPSQWGLFKNAKQKRTLLSLETLKEPFPFRKDSDEAELAYAEALLFVQWLDKKCGAVQLIRWARQYQGLDKALTRCTGWEPTELAQNFPREVLAKVSIPQRSDVQFLARDISGGDPLDVESQNMDQTSENVAQLPDEASKQGRYPSASTEMGKAFHATVPRQEPEPRRGMTEIGR